MFPVFSSSLQNSSRWMLRSEKCPHYLPQETIAYSPDSTPLQITIALDLASDCPQALAASQNNNPQLHPCSYVPGTDTVHVTARQSPAPCSPHTSAAFARSLCQFYRQRSNKQESWILDLIKWGVCDIAGIRPMYFKFQFTVQYFPKKPHKLFWKALHPLNMHLNTKSNESDFQYPPPHLAEMHASSFLFTTTDGSDLRCSLAHQCIPFCLYFFHREEQVQSQQHHCPTLNCRLRPQNHKIITLL